MITSLTSHIKELLFRLLKASFDIISISESRTTKNNLPTININIPRYNGEHTPNESKTRGTLEFMSEKMSYKLCSDLTVYSPKQLELIFNEILRPDY